MGLAAFSLLLGPAISPAQAYTYDEQTVVIKNVNSDLCLEVADWRMDWGAPVRQWQCTGGANQQWVKVVDTAPGKAIQRYYRNVNSGACLEIAGANSNWNGAIADQWQCNGGNNQAFQITQGGFMPVMSATLMCLEIADWSMNWGAPARLWDCTNKPNQQWRQEPVR
ncbi:RICIN domain-containing protein [Kitasatospora sp. KL5]|uniref:RICIN domain-containing protein n=1 Tax=Kitasatospora sp. KL5 TaxID=3425125 RepID=UPI003D6E8728